MGNSTLKFLGRDSGFGKLNNSAYYEERDKFILIDCGYTVFNILKEKFDLNKYKEIDIIITHLHNDHAGSLSQLILYLWFIYNKKANIICKCNNIKEYLSITGVPEEAYYLTDQLKDFKFIKTEHVKYLDSYGFEIKLNNKNIVYTSDTAKIDAFLSYIKKAQELYIDVSRYGGAHLKIDEIIELLKEIKGNGTDVYLMHLDEKDYIKEVTENQFYTG